jgi:FtsP/CotA-like multicopper oxidase with cupredoxin domain
VGFRFLPFVTIAVAGCGPRATATTEPDVSSPLGWDRSVTVAEARDRNPAVDVVEIDLEARLADVEIKPGLVTKAWTYDGGIPGPRIRAKVGDRLIVHFKNSLPEATTVHWHGLRIPNDMDGHGDPKVEPGATFTYDFVLPDAGTFWYHPHVNSAAQVGFGLYGALVVEDPEEKIAGDQTTLVLSDMSLEDDGRPADPTVGGQIGDVFGREGELLLVNGKIRPKLLARAGAPQRWRLINAAKSRYYRIALDGHELVRIGGDGGLRESPITSKEIVLTPGERADLIIVPRGAAGQIATLRWLPFERGYGTAFARDPEPVLDLELSADGPADTPPLPTRLRTIEPLDRTGAKIQSVRLTEGQVEGKSTFSINGAVYPGTVLRATVGSTEVWDVQNETDAHHPFHLHGFFFQVLGGDGRPESPGEWKDTIDIPRKQGRKLVVRYDDRPGEWMFHCHILDHAEIGMMATLLVERPGSPLTPTPHEH